MFKHYSSVDNNFPDYSKELQIPTFLKQRHNSSRTNIH